MGVGLAILTETKVTDDRHPRLASGYKILALKAVSYGKRIARIMRWNQHTS